MEKTDRMTSYWVAVTMILFPVLILVGVLLRGVQAQLLPALEDLFYQGMTLHGLGMVGVFFVASMTVAASVLARHVRPSTAVSRIALFGTVVGVVMLIVAILPGGFGAGWYFLYPLPLRGNWASWATVVFLAALAVLGVAWLLWCLDLLRAIAGRYRLPEALGWHYIAGRTGPEVPPSVLIITVSLIACISCLLAAVMVLGLFFYTLLTGASADALLMKNLTFFFGHVLVNISLYLGVAAVYEVLPQYAGRPWKTNRIVAISWNSVLVIVLLAYAHHLYMDFVQPLTLHYIGQVASYASSIPAAIVTIFGALLLVYHAPMRWSLAPTFFYLGLMGWAIGGVGAVIDSTIAVNSSMHNTLWVPAHFHSYMLMGLGPMLLGYFYHVARPVADPVEKTGKAWLIAALFVIGGYGFLLAFYFAGADSIPRRFAQYPAELGAGALYAFAGMVSALLLLIGFAFYAIETTRRWIRAAA